MPVSPAEFEAYAEAVREAYAAAEASILERLAKRAAEGPDPAPDDTDNWLGRKLADLRRVRAEVERELKALEKVVQEAGGAVELAYQAGAEQADADISDLEEQVGRVLRQPEEVVEQHWNATSRIRVETMVRAMLGKMAAAHLRIVRASEDVYRQVVYEAARQVAAGTMTRLQATQAALNEFADRGIGAFVDKAGRTWDMASYAEMAIRTSVGQAGVQGHVDRLLAMGFKLAMVSDSPEECELCRPWEGAVLSLTGEGVGQRVQLAGRSWTVVKASLQQAIAAGLFHANCTHRLGAVVEGLTKPLRGVANPEGYEQRQQQRYIERQIRRWKRRAAVAQTDEARRQAEAKVREWQARMREFIKDTGRRRLRYREQLMRPGRGFTLPKVPRTDNR